MKPSERSLARHAKIVTMDQTSWQVDEFQPTKGNRTKYIGNPTRQESPIKKPPYRYFWKESYKNYPLEFWSEVIAYHVGAVMGVAVPVCYPCVYIPQQLQTSVPSRKYGSPSQFNYNPSHRDIIFDGGEILSTIKPDFDRRKGSDHSVQLVINAFSLFDNEDRPYEQLFQQFVFDAIIGNSDRHQENWAIIVKRANNEEEMITFKIAPAFDNGSSLGRELTDEQLMTLFEDPARLERYISKGTAHIRWQSGASLETLSHEELMRRHLITYPELFNVFDRVINFSPQQLCRSVKRVCKLSREITEFPSLQLSDLRQEFLCKLMLRRQQRLIEMRNSI